jgi:hypothetical protein
MTPEEEVRRLNRLIRQYEDVWRTTPDADQKERASRQLRELRAYRDKILAVNVIDRGKVDEPKEAPDALAEWPLLRELEAADDKTADLDVEVRHVALYLDHFSQEYLPFLTETRLKLDLKRAIERDAFYRRFQELERRLEDWREAHRRLDDGGFNRDLENEIRTRLFKLKRILAVEASRFFRSLQRFARVLVEDARTDGVQCLNAKDEIAFDPIEGVRRLAGRTVEEALGELEVFATEAVDYLSIPEIGNQESDSADRR